MDHISLFCKTYSADLIRVKRLLESIAIYNIDKIKTYLSVPEKELNQFEAALQKFNVKIVTDQSIFKKNPKIELIDIERSPGTIQQQVVKAEFWRLGYSATYVCMDSDAKFIKPFHTTDFLYKENLPYTVMDEAQEFLEFILTTPKQKIYNDFHRGGAVYQKIFGRKGRVYSFGPMPVIWHRAVWESLESNYLDRNDINIYQAISKCPSEIPWYGEALLAYEAIPLRPCQPLFKVYHYANQYDLDFKNGWTEDLLSKIYLGVIYQSSWQRELDWPKEAGSLGSRMIRRLKRYLGRI